ncbi:MAG TPA: VTT domain-containing protein [Casimicrobiaceae bacterium]|nr:VTT domain-containing protein [Casimicrobiaceae bacterium]
MESHLQSLIAYLSTHPALALGVIFGAAFLEALAVVGTIVPGSSIVFAGGVLVGLKALDPWPAVASAIVGAVLGDGVSYWLGHHFRWRIRAMWPLRQHPWLLARGQDYFERNGGKSVFLGRFLGPIRAIVPVIAGMSAMTPARFYLMNVLSAFGWALAHMLPGILFGASLQLAGAISSRLLILVGVLLAGLWLVAQLTRLTIHYGGPMIVALRDRVVERARAGRGRVSHAVLSLFDPERRESGVLLVSAVMLIAAAWLFLGILEDVVNGDPLVRLDRSIYDALQALRTAWGDNVMVAITELGSAYVMVPVIAIVALWLALTRRRRTLGYWVAAAVFASLSVLALKYAVGRERPVNDYAAIDALSFPSGHAAVGMVVYGFLASLIGRGKPGWQKGVIGLTAAVAILAVAFSRLYLGVHWFSDVAASLALGLAWISLLTIAYTTHVRERPLRALPVSLLVVGTIALSGSAYVLKNHAIDLARYAGPPAMSTLSFSAWRSGGWRRIAQARSELAGRAEEPFALQWTARRGTVVDTLSAAGWRRPAPWGVRTALLWLLPSTPVDELPVLPKFHRGQPPGLTLLYPIDAHTRATVRLWQVADVTAGAKAGGSASAAADGSGGQEQDGPVPLWVAMVTIERAQVAYRLLETIRTSTDFAMPARLLAATLRGVQVQRELRSNGAPLLLVW